MSFSDNFFNFREKYIISGKFLGISGKFFSYLGKNVIYPENFFEMTSLHRPTVANISGKKILDVLYFSKSAPQSLALPPTFRSFLRPSMATHSSTSNEIRSTVEQPIRRSQRIQECSNTEKLYVILISIF